MKKLIILILIIIFATTGCMVTATNKSNNKNDPPEPTQDEERKLGVGDAVNVKGVRVLFESVEKSYGDRDEDFSAFAPSDGKVFIVCNFLVENNSDDDFNISSLYFEAYEDGFAIDSYIFTSGIDVEDLSGTASPGKKIKGALVYEVSEEFDELELEYQPSIWSNKKAIFLYKNE